MIEGTDWIQPDARHQTMVGFLGAYADEELAPDLRREVESHVTECNECRRELRLQLALRARLQAEDPAPTPSAVIERLQAHLKTLGTGPGNHDSGGTIRRWLRGFSGLTFGMHPLVSWGGWLIAAGLAGLWVLGAHRPATQGMGMSMGPLVPVAVDSIPEPIADAALQDFRRVASEDLPRGPRLAAVRAEVPFSVPALRSLHMRLIGSWTTEISGVQAAVLAYRCHDRLVVQYVIPEHVFFRPPRVRQAIAAAGLYAAGQGKVHAIAWPGTDNGSFLVGEFTAAELAAMRD